MLVRLLLVTLGALLAVAPWVPAHGEGGSAEADLDRVSEQIRTGVAADGAAWVVSTPRGVRTGAVGPGIDAGTDFLWGSVSKAVAGLVAADLVCRDELDLAAPVLPLLAAEEPPADRRWDGVTVGMLLDHTSGVPELYDQLDDPDPHRSPSAAVRGVLAEPLVADPGAAHHYSSANYLLLQVVLERATGEPYPDQVTDLMTRRGVTDPVVSRDAAQTRVTPGHRIVLGRPTVDGVRYDDLGLAYGYLGGSARDLAALGRSVLRDLQREGCTAGAVATRPRVQRGGGSAYGLGWRVGGLGTDATVLWHGGALPGHAALLALVPEAGAVVVVLQDAYSPWQDALLMAPGLDAARQLAGGAGTGSTAPVGYWAFLVGLAAGTTGLGVAAVRLVRRPPARRRRALAWVAPGVVGLAVPLLLPRLTGLGDLATLYRWQPDVAGLAVACGVSGLAVGAAAFRGAVRRLGA